MFERQLYEAGQALGAVGSPRLCTGSPRGVGRGALQHLSLVLCLLQLGLQTVYGVGQPGEKEAAESPTRSHSETLAPSSIETSRIFGLLRGLDL